MHNAARARNIDIKHSASRLDVCHVYELRHEISVFMEKKGKDVSAFADPLCMCDYRCVILSSLHHGAPQSAERQTTGKRTTNQ